MKITGGCYCGAVRYEAEGEPMMAAQCHCRECQYITGGNPNIFMAMPTDGFKITQGQTSTFTREDLENAVTRHFCPKCGTAIGTQPPGFPAFVLKVGTMDDPSVFKPNMAIFTMDQQEFHHIADGLPSFERMPG